jgi:predicted MFS family arabinose efflux permease
VWAVEAVIGVLVVVAVTVGLRTRAVARPSGPPALRTLRLLPGATALIVSYAGFAMGYVVFSSYLVAALKDDAGLSAGHAATVYSLVGLFGILGGLLVGRMSDRLGRRNLMAGAHTLMAVCALAVLLGAEPWVAIAAACFGVFASGMPAVVAAYVADHLEAVAVAGVLGVVTIAFGVSQAIGPLLGGWLADATGAFTLTFLLSASAHTVGAIAALGLPDGRRDATVRADGRAASGVPGGHPGSPAPHP